MDNPNRSELRITYTGDKPLTNVHLELARHYQSKNNPIEYQATFANWQPGETRTFILPPPRDGYSGVAMIGSAECEQKKVTLAGKWGNSRE